MSETTSLERHRSPARCTRVGESLHGECRRNPSTDQKYAPLVFSAPTPAAHRTPHAGKPSQVPTKTWQTQGGQISMSIIRAQRNANAKWRRVRPRQIKTKHHVNAMRSLLLTKHSACCSLTRSCQFMRILPSPGRQASGMARHRLAATGERGVASRRPPRGLPRGSPGAEPTAHTPVRSRAAPGPPRGRTASGRRDATRIPTCKICDPCPCRRVRHEAPDQKSDLSRAGA